MVFLLVLILGIVLLVISEWSDERCRRSNKMSCLDKSLGILGIPGWCFFWLGFILCVIMINTHCVSSESISDMEAFYKNNNKVYQETMELHPNTVSVQNSDGAQTHTTIQYKYLLQVTDYNSNLLWYRKYQDNILIGAFIFDVPGYLQPIGLTKEIPK